MKNSKITVIMGLIFTALMSSCSGKLSYLPESAGFKNKHYQISTQMEANPVDGKVNLKVRINNLSEKSIVCALPELSLNSSDGLMSFPMRLPKAKMVILPGETESYSIDYLPINSQLLDQRLRLKGDLRQKYVFNTAFIRDTDGNPLLNTNLSLSLSGDAHKKYLDKYGIEKGLKFYAINENREEFIANQNKYMLENKIFTEKHSHKKTAQAAPLSIMLSGDEIIIEEFVIKIVAYKTGGKCKLYVRAYNRGTQHIKITPDDFAININGKTYPPKNDITPQLLKLFPNIKEKTKIDAFYILQNYRVPFTLEYNIPEDCTEFVLSRIGLKDENDKFLIGQKMKFKIENNR